MIQEYQIRVLPVQATSTQTIIEYLAREKGLDARTVKSLRVLRRSIDARQRTIYVNLSVRAYINEMPTDDEYVHTEYPDVSGKPRVIVVGAGPGGLFAALRLIELGLCPHHIKDLISNFLIIFFQMVKQPYLNIQQVSQIQDFLDLILFELILNYL